MECYTLLGKDYYLKIEADRRMSKVVAHLIETPRHEFAEYLIDRIMDCFGLSRDGALRLCNDLNYDTSFICSGFNNNRLMNSRLALQLDMTS